MESVRYEEISDPDRKAAICERVLRDLPEWFGIEEATLAYIADARRKPMVAALEGGEPLGFVSLTEDYPLAAEIHAMGVLKARHGGGIGARLVALSVERCRAAGRKLLTVKTLSPRHPDLGYAATRRFYERAGFFPYEENLEIWGEANPCLLMAMVV